MSTGVGARRLSGSARRIQILEAARAEFVTRGLAGARMHEVAAAAGVTNALIYQHFRSKENLFQEAVMAPLEARIAAQVASLKDLPVDPEGVAQGRGTREWVLELLRFFDESIEGLGVVLFGDRDNGRDFYNRHLRPIMDSYVEAGKLNLPRWPHRDYDIDTAVHTVFGVAFWLALDQSMQQRTDDLEARADLIVDLLLSGTRARGDERG
jgi:AcrR family transcriptional regulator